MVKPRIPQESEEQQALIRWADYMAATVRPELRLLYHIPNGGTGGEGEAGRFRAEGVRAGVPDLCLPVARGEYHGLYIELKRTKGGKISEKQKEWLDALEKEGYCAAVCHGWDEAREKIETYLDGGKQRAIR